MLKFYLYYIYLQSIMTLFLFIDARLYNIYSIKMYQNLSNNVSHYLYPSIPILNYSGFMLYSIS